MGGESQNDVERRRTGVVGKEENPESATANMARTLRERGMQFEELVTELSARFINVSVDQVDSGIEEAQRLFCLNLNLDRSSLFQRFEEEPDTLLLTHFFQRENPVHTQLSVDKRFDPKLRANVYWARSDQDQEYLRIDARALFPWIYEQLQDGRLLAITDLDDLPESAVRDKEMLLRYQTASTVVVPLRAGGIWLGCMTFASLCDQKVWPESLIRRFRFVADVFTQVLARKRADKALREREEALQRSYTEIKQLKDRLQAESDYLKAEIEVTKAHHGIIGRSRAILQALHLVEQVAPTPSAVLLTGETGTGKELLARAIHRLSPRKDRLMVEVNCAALPDALVESELFGRERGAYTGALTSRVGRFEVADNSTIFLDEVSELSLEVQAKLLRVLQEGQFQRLGDSKNHKVNVRVVAATNRDLLEAVRQGKFRQDLYYRLNVFPIIVPPLRDRPEDIPLLVSAFVQELSSRMGKRVLKVPARVMEELERHRWPGNIRELRNVIERAVILSPGDTLEVTLLQEFEQPIAEPITLAESEKQHILKALEKTTWRIKGPRGAAKLLGLKPGTLYSRMRKLGIPHRREQNAQSITYLFQNPKATPASDTRASPN